jgi:hypothetical protein
LELGFNLEVGGVRSGGASAKPGFYSADLAFESVHTPDDMEIYLPWPDKTRIGKQYIVPVFRPEQRAIVKQLHPAPSALKDSHYKLHMRNQNQCGS